MKIRTAAQIVSTLALTAFIVPFWNGSSASAAPLPGTFFSHNWNTAGGAHIPSVPFGGMRLWDTGTTWKDLETSSNVFNWAPLDTWLAQAGIHDVLYTFGKVPAWNGGGTYYTMGGLPTDFTNGNGTWKGFVTNLVKHSLASSTAHIKYYEIWNEPDLSDWEGTSAQLMTMAQQAYSIIHSLDTNALIVGPGCSSAGSFGWIQGYYAAGGAAYQDIVGYHLYLYSGTPGDFPGNPQSALGDINTLRSLMAQYNISSKPIWYTEGSWGDQTHTNVAAMTVDDRTAYLAQEYLFLWSKGVARYYWYSWDNPTFGTLWTASGGVNPAGIAYGQLYNWLVGSIQPPTNAAVQGGDGTWTCNLTLSDGFPAQIVWNATTQKAITVATNFTVYQTLDNATQHTIVNNSVTIGNKPVLIIAGGPPQPANLALNRPVTVSSSSDPSLVGTNAVDGNFATRWSSAYSDNQWIYVDLGAVTSIEGITLNWENAFASSYKIQVSTNAATWTDVYSTTNGGGGTEQIRFSAKARYVKMLGIKRATVYGYSLWEFGVFGEVQPAIANHPSNITVLPGGTAKFTVGATGGELSYQWKFNGTNIAGANGASLVISNVSPANIGAYTVSIINGAGLVTSAPVTLASLEIHWPATLYLNGPIGSNYLIQATSVLPGGWTTLTNITLPSQPYIYSDTVTNKQRFYRAVAQ